MRTRFMVGTFGLVLAIAMLAPVSAQAQWFGFGGGELERAIRPGPYTPYNGNGWLQRYHYSVGPMLYFGYDAHWFGRTEYYDRIWRAEHFGHLWSQKPPLFNRLLGHPSSVDLFGRRAITPPW